MINLFQPSLGQRELEAVEKVFESNWVGKGPLTDRFEAEFARHVGADRNAVRSVSSCTEGMFQAMELLGIGPGDEVILPTISFVGAANAIAACGARPVFCDVDSRTLNPSASDLEAVMTDRTRAALILHYGGLPCEMDEICALLAKRSVRLLEDSACSVASRYRGRACGTFGDVGVWSFDAMKVLVTGDGGMVYCHSAELADRFEKQAYLGLETSSGLSSTSDTCWWAFEMSGHGRRSIMNDVASAIGLVQLERLPAFIESRRRVYEAYDRELAALDWLTLPPAVPEHMESSYYFYWVQCEPDVRDSLARFLRDQNIYTTFRYYPLHWVEFYGVKERFPGAERAAQTTLCIPIHQSLSDGDVKQVVEAIEAFGASL